MIVLGGTVATTPPAHADSWSLPTKSRHYSPNRTYRLDIVPRPLESQLAFFSDKVKGAEPAGNPPGSVRVGPSATLRRKRGALYRTVARFPLLNDVAPVTTLISDRGDFIVTLDDWHSRGHGSDTIVIYRGDGSPVAALALRDILTEGDILNLRRSVSSIDWWDSARIDQDSAELVLLVSARRRGGEVQPRSVELRVGLETGRPRQSPRDRFPQLRVRLASGFGDSRFAVPDEPSCLDPLDVGKVPAASASSAQDDGGRPIETVLPVYPDVARVAWLQDSVVVEALVGPTGEVRCARVLSGHPILRWASTEAALRWQFEPLDRAAASGFLSSRIVFNFRAVDPSR